MTEDKWLSIIHIKRRERIAEILSTIKILKLSIAVITLKLLTITNMFSVILTS